MTREELERYPFELRKLSKEDGGGYLISYIDFNDCISDGETIEEAIENGLDALNGLIETLKELNKPIPQPNSKRNLKVSGKFLIRLPKSLHTTLLNQAKLDNISMNTLAVALIAEGLGRKTAYINPPN